MRTRFFRSLWDVLSEVPGWPDAPRTLRIRRTWPMAIPCVAALGLVGWSLVAREPAREAERRAHAHLMALEKDIASLRLACSDQQAVDLAARANDSAAMLLPSAEAAGTELNALIKTIESLGWQATFQLYEAGSAETSREAVMGFSPALTRLTPAVDNTRPFASLLAVIDALAPVNRHMEITRLSATLDAGGQLTAEVNLRLAYRIDHEKAAQ